MTRHRNQQPTGAYSEGHAYSVQDAAKMSRELAAKVMESFHPDLVLGILGDGMFPSEEITDSLSVPLESIEIKRPTFCYLPPRLVRPMSSKAGEKSGILLVDDIYDSGRTMEIGRQYLKSLGHTTVMTAVLDYMEEGEKLFRLKAPDFWVIRDDNCSFPWRADSPEWKNYTDYMFRRISSPKSGKPAK